MLNVTFVIVYAEERAEGGEPGERKHKARAKNFHKNLLESNETFSFLACACVYV